MDTLENRSVDQSELGELRAECQALRQIVSSVLVLVLMVAGALDIYLLRQWRMARAELQRRGPQITQFVAEYNQVSLPAINDFVKKLNDYEKIHPDFTPILIKYHLKLSVTNGTPPTSATPGKN